MNTQPERTAEQQPRAALETFYAQTIQLLYDAEDAMDNESTDRQAILETLIADIRDL